MGVEVMNQTVKSIKNNFKVLDYKGVARYNSNIGVADSLIIAYRSSESATFLNEGSVLGSVLGAMK